MLQKFVKTRNKYHIKSSKKLLKEMCRMSIWSFFFTLYDLLEHNYLDFLLELSSVHHYYFYVLVRIESLTVWIINGLLHFKLWFLIYTSYLLPDIPVKRTICEYYALCKYFLFTRPYVFLHFQKKIFDASFWIFYKEILSL